VSTRPYLVAAAGLLCLTGAAAISRAAGAETGVTERYAGGEPVTFAQVLKLRARIPDEKNSALALLRTFTYLPHCTDDACYGKPLAIARVFWARRKGEELTRPHSPQMRDILDTYLGMNRRALDLIREAARLPRGVYPYPDEPRNPYDLDLGHLVAVRAAARLCLAEAVLCAQNGDGARAADSILAIRRVASSLGDPPVAIEALVRCSVGDVFVRCLERSLALCELPGSSLALLQDEVSREETEISLTLPLLGEKARGHYVFSLAAPELRAFMDGPFWNWCQPTEGELTHYCTRAQLREEDARCFDGVMGQAIAIVSMPLRRRIEEADRLRQEIERIPEERLVARALLTGLPPMVERPARCLARLSVVRAAVAAERWRQQRGRWPDSLGQLVPELLAEGPEDPYAGGRLGYLRTDSGVVVYSIGPDREDDRGMSLLEVQRKAGTDGGRVGYDLSFRLFNPELRGAETLSFRQEVASARLTAAEMKEAGLTRINLLEAGFTAVELRELGWE